MSGVGYDPIGEFLKDGVGVPPPASVTELLRAAVLSSDARVLLDERGRWHVEGDPTEGALVVAAEKAGLDQATLNEQQPRRHEIAFTSERRRMTTLHEVDGSEMIAYSKGAVDAVLPDCLVWERDGHKDVLSETAREGILALEREMASAGLRVLAVASKRHASLPDAERGMTWLGLVGMMDPPRAEARAAVQTCWDAGITPVMITGDHPLTATAIAREIGLLDGRRVVSGQDLSSLTDDDLVRDVRHIGVYARVSPADKLRVIAAWQSRGDVVAMTGDGVNDAPALKKADVGIAMGVSGTDVSKEAAAVTLLDDNFATIVAAVEEGRIVFGNIKKYLTYLLSSNVGEIVLMAGAALGGLPLPLTAVQILYVNLATDGLPALALAVDPPEPDLMTAQAARSARRRLHPPARGAALERWPLVGGRQHHVVCMAPPIRATARARDGDHVCLARADSILQGLQLPIRSTVGSATAVREHVAELRCRVGTAAAVRGDLHASSARTVRHVQPECERLAPRDNVGADCGARPSRR